MAGCSVGTPGLNTTRSVDVNVSGLWPPASTATPSFISASLSGTSARISDNVTRAPRSISSFAAARPLLAAPTTVTRLPLTSKAKSSPQLERRQAEQRENDRYDHDSRDHLRFAPS